MKLTIRRIAEMTGVSRGTIDKVLHDRPGVSDEVRARIKKLLEEQEYRPNRAAKALNMAQIPRRIAVIIPPLNNPYFAKIKAGMDDAYERLRDYGMQIEYFFCDVTHVREVLSLINYVEESGFDGLIIRGTRSESLRDRLNSYAQTDRPVLLIDSDVPGVNRLCLVGEDCIRSGRLAASLLAKSIGHKGQVAIISGSEEVSAHKQRIQGFMEAIQEKYPEMTVVETIQSLEQSVIAYDKTSSLLGRHPALGGIFSVAGCTGDIGQAILDSGRQGRVKLVCYNFTPDIAALVRKGVVEFTIGLAPFRQGSLAIETLFRYLFNKEKPDGKFIKMPIFIGVDENIELYEQEN
ncbi:MAG: LacI family DNA-binding transcriptional regulator [Intestinibacillus sp.]